MNWSVLNGHRAIGRYENLYFLIFCFQSFVWFSPEVSATVNPIAYLLRQVSCIAVVKNSFHVWPNMFGVMRFQPFKVCKCEFINTVIYVVSLSYVHKSELLVIFVCFVYFSCFDFLKVNVAV